MKITNVGQAGSLESQDILITIEKGKKDSGIIIELTSPSAVQYGSRIKTEIESVIKEYAVNDVLVQAIDKGALGFTIKARTETALLRALED